MQRPLALTLLALTLVCGNSCETIETERPARRYTPAVLMPENLSANERRLVPYVVDVLSDAGYRPTRGGGAEFELTFRVDDGPVNADVHLTLLRRGSPVAKSYARVGGPRILLRRQEVIQESFEKCLNDFEHQLGDVDISDRSSRYDSYDDDYLSRPRRQDDYGYDRDY